jgi:hypothetical protein
MAFFAGALAGALPAARAGALAGARPAARAGAFDAALAAFFAGARAGALVGATVKELSTLLGVLAIIAFVTVVRLAINDFFSMVLPPLDFQCPKTCLRVVQLPCQVERRRREPIKFDFQGNFPIFTGGQPHTFCLGQFLFGMWDRNCP